MKSALVPPCGPRALVTYASIADPVVSSMGMVLSETLFDWRTRSSPRVQLTSSSVSPATSLALSPRFPMSSTIARSRSSLAPSPSVLERMAS